MVADASINACINEGIENVLITSWKDDGAEASIFIILPSLAHIASIVYEKDEREIFKDSVGYGIDDFMLLDLPDEVYGDIDIYNPSKYGLYNDPLLGLCDYHLREIDHNYFKNIKERLEKVNNPDFGYIFDTVAKMCDVMEYKMDLGIRTRNAYLNGDKTELERLANEIYPLVAERIKSLYDSACYQWEREAKLNGFEVQDIRLGGLEKRIRHISRILKMYLNGEIEKIESLEEKPQAFYMNKKEGEGIILSIWEQTAMTKPWN